MRALCRVGDDVGLATLQAQTRIGHQAAGKNTERVENDQ